MPGGVVDGGPLFSAAAAEWIMMGGRMPDGRVCVLASKDLRRMEMVAKYLSGDLTPYGQGISPTWHARVQMKDVFYAIGPDYRAALATLFERWSPEPEANGTDRALGATTE